MAKTYKKNSQNVYKLPLYRRFWFWLLISLILSILLFLIGSIISNSIFQIGKLLSVYLIAGLLIWRACSLRKSVIEAKTIINYVRQTKAEKAITKTLLDTMMLNHQKDSPQTISVPLVKVVVCDSTPPHISVEIEKLAGMYDIEKLIEDINASFRGKLAAYAVISSRITEDGLYYKFVLEDVATDRTWRPSNIELMKQKSHEIKLQKGLTINLADRPHILVWGKSGSGKSSFLWSVIIQLLLADSGLYFIDPKSEFSSLALFYPAERIQEDVEPSLEILRHICQQLKERQRIVARAVRERKEIGLRAYDIGLKPIVLIADEIGSLMASMDSKQKKEFLALLTQIVQKGRSVSVFCIIATQSPKVDTTLSSDIRSQFATKILLGSANPETQRMAFDGAVATKGGVEKFKGYYICDGITDENPLLFAVTDLHKYGLNKLEWFEKAYKMDFGSDEQ